MQGQQKHRETQRRALNLKQINPVLDTVNKIHFNIIFTVKPRPAIAVWFNFQQALMIQEHRNNQTHSSDNTSKINICK